MPAWQIAWLVVGQVLSLGLMSVGVSRSALGQSVGLGPLQAPSIIRPSPISPRPQLSDAAAPTRNSFNYPARQQRLTALLAEHVSAPGKHDDFMWIADAASATGAEEIPNETPGETPQAGLGAKVNDATENNAGRNQSRKRGDRLDSDTVRRGQEFFDVACTACHDAERATSKRKSLAGWLATVRRMAAKEDADVPADQHLAIATYLASLNPAYQTGNEEGAAKGSGAEENGEGAAAAEQAAAEAGTPPFTLNGTLSPVWRGTDWEVENRGFFPDVWLGIEWRPSSSPVSGKLTVCASCHGTDNGLGVELAEAAVTLDLCHLLTNKPREERQHCRTTADLTVGRFIVPFGAFSGRVHPGALRTVSLPLMYNMGRRVGPIAPGQPVINLPYSDEGADLHLKYEFHRDCDASFDAYAVNGLQVGGPAEFFFSRSYRDNNSNVAVGGRGTIGNRHWRFGGSIAGGELQDEGLPLQAYSLAGGDVSYRQGEFFRAYYEYAIRQEDAFAGPNSQSIAYGNLVEAEVLLLKDQNVSFLARFDTLEHRGALGDLSTERFTYGLNWVLPGGSLLILDHEHWIFDDRSPANIFGLRWTVAF
jgi:hypothetical protein